MNPTFSISIIGATNTGHTLNPAHTSGPHTATEAKSILGAQMGERFALESSWREFLLSGESAYVWPMNGKVLLITIHAG